MARRKGSAKNQSRPGRLRIVAGKWRSRFLPIPDQEGLRPTSERIRETLFNWLAMEIVGSRCLDAFSGSGALAFEALSRGASEVVMLEIAPAVAESLKLGADSLDAAGADVVCADALDFLERAVDKPYDIVFLDPPFNDNIVEKCCRLLQSNGWLNESAVIYVEQDKKQPVPEFPPAWRTLKNKNAGNVRYMLLRAG